METFLKLLTFLLLLISLPVANAALDPDHIIKGRFLGCYLYPFCPLTDNAEHSVSIPNASYYPWVTPEDCFEHCYGGGLVDPFDESSVFMIRWNMCVCLGLNRHHLIEYEKGTDEDCDRWWPSLDSDIKDHCMAYGAFYSYHYQYCPLYPGSLESKNDAENLVTPKNNQIVLPDEPAHHSLVHECNIPPEHLESRLNCGNVYVTNNQGNAKMLERKVYREFHTVLERNSPRTCLEACLKEGHLDMSDFDRHKVIIALGENGYVRQSDGKTINCGCYFADEWQDIHWFYIREIDPGLCIWCPDLSANCYDPYIDNAFCGGYYYKTPIERYLVSIYEYIGNITAANCLEYVPPLPSPRPDPSTDSSTEPSTAPSYTPEIPTTTPEIPTTSPEIPTTTPEIPTTSPEISTTSVYTIKTTQTRTTELTTMVSSTSESHYEVTPSPIPFQCLNNTVRCTGKDKFGQDWEGCAGQVVRHACFYNASGIAVWECMLDGKFKGQGPDYSDCVSFWLEHVEGYLEAETVITANVTNGILTLIQSKYEVSKESNGTQPEYYGHEVKHIFELGKKALKMTTEDTETSLFENLTYKAMWIMGNIFTYREPWMEMDLRNCSETGTRFIQTMEESVLELTTRILKNESFAAQGKYQRAYQSHAEFNMGCGVQLKEKTEKDKICYPFTYSPEKDSYINIPSNWADYFADQEIEFAGLQIDSKLVNMMFPGNLTTASTIIGGLNDVSDLPEKLINGNLLSFSFDTNLDLFSGLSGFNFTENGVLITIQHAVEAWGSEAGQIHRKLHPGERAKAVLGSAQCVFWDTVNLVWSSEGCRLVETKRTMTVCECFHLTSFALLMDLHKYTGKDVVLEVLTWILSSVSIICLSFCIYVFSTSIKSSRTPRNEITNHLCIWLLIGHFLVLFFMDRHYFYLGNGMCTATGIALHYAFLVVFMWNAMEGLQLYKMVIVVFDDGKDYLMAQRIVSYGLPALIVTITGVSGLIQSENAYGGDAFCWLEGSYIWAFIVPVATITLANLVVLIMCMKKAQDLSHTKIMQSSRKDKTVTAWVRGTLSVAVLLGVTWLVGFLMLTPISGLSKFAGYLFTILNASQGIFLFIFHVWMNENVRGSLKRNFPKLFRNGTPSSSSSTKRNLGKAWSADTSSSSILY